MIDVNHLRPPTDGSQSDPMLYGVTQALMELLPLHDVVGTLVSRLVDEDADVAAETADPTFYRA